MNAVRTALDARTAAAEALERAREGYREQRWSAAETDGLETATLAQAIGDRTTEGRAWGIVAEACKELGRPDGALYLRSLALLDAPDARIWRACVENDYGWHLYGEGRRDEAADLFASAYEIADREGDRSRRLSFDESVCLMLYDAGQYEATRARATEHAALAPDDPEPLCYALRLRTLALLATPDDAGAVLAADAYEAAAVAGGDWDRTCAALLSARARAVAGEADALAAFAALTRAADALDSPNYAAMARLWHFAALRVVDPVRACRRYAELYLPATRDRSPFGQIERAVVDRIWHPLPAIDLTDSTQLDHARASDRLDAALYLAAFRHTGGIADRMADLLGRDRRQVARKMRRLGLEPLPPGRPRRS